MMDSLQKVLELEFQLNVFPNSQAYWDRRIKGRYGQVYLNPYRLKQTSKGRHLSALACLGGLVPATDEEYGSNRGGVCRTLVEQN